MERTKTNGNIEISYFDNLNLVKMKDIINSRSIIVKGEQKPSVDEKGLYYTDETIKIYPCYEDFSFLKSEGLI